MNRRSFFNSLSSAVVGVYLGLHVKPLEIEKEYTKILNNRFEEVMFFQLPSFYDFLLQYPQAK